MLIGSAESDIPKAPEEKTVFLEDMTAAQAASMEVQFPAGLTNLGNTCYMNSTLQLMKAVPELQSSLKQFRGQPTENDLTTSLTASLRDLFVTLNHTPESVPPIFFLQALRSSFPQFAQKGDSGAFMQQDAEECYTQLMLSLSQRLPVFDAKPDERPSTNNSAISQLFAGELVSTLRNVESPEEEAQTKKDSFLKLSCHINSSTNFLVEGLKNSMTEHISKNSETLGREATYERGSQISRLPYYLSIQFVRFFWRQDKQSKAKILRPVEFPFTLDLYEFCSDELKETLNPTRKRVQEIEDEIQEQSVKRKKEGGKDEMEVEEKKAESPQGPVDPKTLVNTTAMYELAAVVTHKGRSADGGHYVAWVKESDDKWLKYDDDHVSAVSLDEIKKLSGKGGGDWHMAYLALYRTKPVPSAL